MTRYNEPTELSNLLSPTLPATLVILILFIVVLYLFILKARKDVFKKPLVSPRLGKKSTKTVEKFR